MRIFSRWIILFLLFSLSSRSFVIICTTLLCNLKDSKGCAPSRNNNSNPRSTSPHFAFLFRNVHHYHPLVSYSIFSCVGWISSKPTSAQLGLAENSYSAFCFWSLCGSIFPFRHQLGLQTPQTHYFCNYSDPMATDY